MSAPIALKIANFSGEICDVPMMIGPAIRRPYAKRTPTITHA
jgi:hypothetical protein